MATVTLPSRFKGNNPVQLEAAFGLLRGDILSVNSTESTVVADVKDSIVAAVTAKLSTEAAERTAMIQGAAMIDAITSLADARMFLKKLCKRLLDNGALP